MTQTVTSDPRRWYCLRTATRRENDAVQKLREHFTEALIEDGVTCEAEIYLPVEKRRSLLRRPKDGEEYEIVERPLMPGYLFVKVASADAVKQCVRDVEAKINGVEFIHAVLEYRRNDGRLIPYPIASSLIEGLMKEQADGDFDFTPIAKRYRPSKNDRVVITRGPFSGFLAQVIAMSADERRVSVEVSIFGRTGPAEMPVGDIAPATVDDVAARPRASSAA